MLDSEFISIDVDSVLWRTAGLNWDYDFVLLPTALVQDSWYWFHRSIFESIEPNNVPRNLLGNLGSSHKEAPFIATTFLDEHYTDHNGRPIAHFLVWFHLKYSREQIAQNLPLNWGKQIVSQLETPFEIIFSSDQNPSLSNSTVFQNKTTLKVPSSNGIQAYEDIGTLKKNGEVIRSTGDNNRLKRLKRLKRLIVTGIAIAFLLGYLSLEKDDTDLQAEAQPPSYGEK